MRISDWSSDVCSSDLPGPVRVRVMGAGGDQRRLRAEECLAQSVRIERLQQIVLDAARHQIAIEANIVDAAGCDHDRARLAHLRQRVDVIDRIAGFRQIDDQHRGARSEEHTSELQSLMRISYAVFCLKKKKKTHEQT